MNILTISGSSRSDSSNSKLLDGFPLLFPDFAFRRYYSLEDLPLFKVAIDKHPLPQSVVDWRKAVAESKSLIFCTPEYIHNIPALLKNALEWLTTSGELVDKPVLALTFTPHTPRGEKAMQSLLWSLQALNARVVGQLALYQQEIKFDKEGNILLEGETLEMLKEAVLLIS